VNDVKKSKLLADKSFYNDLRSKLRDKFFREGFEREKLVIELSMQIEKIRKQKHMSQKQLADKTHISQQEISKIEHGGRNITLDTLEKVVAGLGATIDIRLKANVG
jgi:HTH-type transcriptional regulator / antitoxin HipB